MNDAEAVQGRWSLQILDVVECAAVSASNSLPVDLVGLVSVGLDVLNVKPLYNLKELQKSHHF